jgi:aspartyl-tRNA(Asn)/glutamyl-tRNA(Gln) amidotransferase subunit A
MEATDLNIREASDLFRRRQLSPVELADQFLERIEKIDPKLNSFITVNQELAQQQAREAEQTIAHLDSPHLLCGVPFALKDLYQTKGILTTGGSKVYGGFVPAEDSAVVSNLNAAGAVMLGKLNMHEVALGVTNVNPHFGACHNPWDLERISGGSSGGSAVALAASLCLGSCGSDTGGSIRIPASLCGIVGMKPTYGRVSLRGVIPLSWNLDHAGPMGRCVEDVAIILDCIAGYDPQDPASVNVPVDDYLSVLGREVRGWRIALAEDDFFSRADPEVTAVVQSAAAIFERLGAIIETVSFPGVREAAQANGLMVVSDAAAYHHDRLQERPQDFGVDVLQRLHMGAAYTITDYIRARRVQSTLQRKFNRFFENYDILLTPTTPVTAPPIEGPDAVSQAPLLTRFTAPFNLTGLPAISLPCGFDSRGLPVGLQIVSAAWREAKLLQAASAYEAATEWKNKKPAL